MDQVASELRAGAKTLVLPEASLLADPQIVAAAIYSPDNRLLARYVRPDSSEFIPTPSRITQALTTERGVVVSPIRVEGQVAGTLYLKAQLTQADQDRMTNLVKGSASIFLISILISFAAAYWLQGSISGPISTLAQAADTISREGNYDVRLEIEAGGEIGALVAAFN